MPSGPPLNRPFLHRILPALLFPPVLLLAGCSVGDFLSAYFNTYYNASRAFAEAERELLAGQDPKAAEKVFLPPYTVPAGAKTKFAGVIEKCSKLLQYHPDSPLVDDALMMIGMSYYYQNEHPSAVRKFRELIEGQPRSDLVPEARILLANTLYRSGDREGARTAARDLLAAEDPPFERAIRARAALLLAAIETDEKNPRAALEHYLTAADQADRDEDRYTAFLRAAEMHAELGEFQKAGAAYVEAERNASTYPTEYRAALGRIRMLSAMGRHEDALELLEKMLDDRKNSDFFAELAFERGAVSRAMGDIDAAVEQFQYVDTAYARTPFSPRAAYELGLLYEKNLFRYDSARAAYNRGRPAAGQTPVADSLTRRADALNRYFTLVAEIGLNDSLRLAILFPPDSLTSDTLAAARDSDAALADIRDELPDQGPAMADTGTVSPPDTAAPETLSQVDSSGPALESDVPVEEKEDSLITAKTVPPDSAAPPRVTRVPVAIPLDTVMTRLAGAKSELAALFFNVLERNDSASYWFTRLLEDHPGSRHVPRALYTLAQIAGQDSDASRADSLNRLLAERFPGDEFGITAMRLLGIAAPEDTVDAADALYADAAQTFEKGNHRNALTKLATLLKRFPESAPAARAQYAMGFIFEHLVDRPDSALAHYRSLVEQFPTSPYAAAVKPKLDAVDLHLRKLEDDRKAAADSIRQQQVADSLQRANAGKKQAEAQEPPVKPPEPGMGPPSGPEEPPDTLQEKPPAEETPETPPPSEEGVEPARDNEPGEPPPDGTPEEEHRPP